MHTRDASERCIPSGLVPGPACTNVSTFTRWLTFACNRGCPNRYTPRQDFSVDQDDIDDVQIQLDPPGNAAPEPIDPAKFNGCADLHSDSVPPYSVEVPPHTLWRLCPPIVTGVGDDEQAKNSLEYSWAYIGSEDNSSGVHKVFCDNAWEAVMNLVDRQREQFLTYTADEVAEGEDTLEETKAAYKEDVCECKVNILAPECAVFWPYGGHNRPRARTPQNMPVDSVRGYETRIDCVLEAVYTPNNSSYDQTCHHCC